LLMQRVGHRRHLPHRSQPRRPLGRGTRRSRRRTARRISGSQRRCADPTWTWAWPLKPYPCPDRGGRRVGPTPTRIWCCRRYRTLGTVPEQRDQYRVAVYCDRCAQRRGRGPVLAVAQREPWMVDGHWQLKVARRLPRRLPPESPRVVTSYSGGAVPDRRKRWQAERGRRLVLVPVHALERSAALLICQKCKARPRVAVAKLVELAEQAMAAGRHDAYA
jgi:hypothetical protein